MAFVEMGPVSNTLIRMVTRKFKSKKAQPLFVRDTPRYAGDAAAAQAPIKTAPLNAHEAKEQDALRSLRDAIHADR